MIATVYNIRISPKKVNLIAEMIRRKPVNEASTMLKYTTKRSAPLIYKVLQSAIANAENNFKQDRANLIVEEVLVGKGTTLKRFMPVSRGRAHAIRKRSTHITVKVGVLDTSKTASKRSIKAMKVAGKTTAESPTTEQATAKPVEAKKRTTTTRIKTKSSKS